MPGITESSAREWHRAHVTPTEVSVPASTWPLMPMTAFSRNELDGGRGVVQVVAGEKARRQRVAVDVQADAQGATAGLTAD